MIYATVLIKETIEDKNTAYNINGEPQILENLKTYAKTGIFQSDRKLADIAYIQSSTGDWDYIIQLSSENVEKLMSALLVLRRLKQVKDTKTHIGDLIFRKNP